MSFKQLFFDDQRLRFRQNLKREYGTAEIAGTYQDPNINTPYGWMWARRLPDKTFRMNYMGYGNKSFLGFAAADSDDGVHFTPCDTTKILGAVKQDYPNQILHDLAGEGNVGEIASVLEDPEAQPEERYKMLFCDLKPRREQLYVRNLVLASPDMLHWKEMPDSCWNKVGTEPITGAFHDTLHHCFSVLTRPDCGARRVCLTQTKDWHHFTDPELLMQCDSLDPALTEVYGMNAMEYDGMFIGFPLFFGDFPEGLKCEKYEGGTIHCQLAYSFNGVHWQRSLRTPFLGGKLPFIRDHFGKELEMVFPTSMLRDKDGSILIYSSATSITHGSASSDYQPGNTTIAIFRLRPDGFIRLATEDPAQESIVTMREICWEGGEPVFNLKAENATCAIFRQDVQGRDPIPVLTHEDCVPFSGDSTAWTPVWKNGQHVDDLKEKTIVFELKFRRGEFYSVSGNGIPMMDLEGSRFRKFGTKKVYRGM